MVPSRNLLLRLAEALRVQLVAIDTITPLRLIPVENDFTPSRDMSAGDFVVSAMAQALGPPQVAASLTRTGRDPTNEEECAILCFVDAAGDRQLADVADNPVPKTITGFVIASADMAVIVGAHKFAAPIQYTQVGQLVKWPEVSFRYPQDAVR